MELIGPGVGLQDQTQRPNRHSSDGSKPEAKEKEGTIMKKFGFATVLAGGLAAAAIGLASPAVAAPSGPSNAQDTISDLQQQGYNVIVNRLGDTPLDQATVVAVRPGQTHETTDSRGGGSIKTTVTSETVYVDVK
jgi:hypothetical protein